MTKYLMEHPLEAERLELKTKREKILAERVSPGRVVGLDLSEERLSVAREIADEQGISNVEYAKADVRDLNPKDETFDLAYSRFLFQYLPGKTGEDTLAAMKHLTRPGGRVTVADLDGNHLYRYPLDEEWGQELGQLVHAIEESGFDAFVGRKLYSMFRKVGLQDLHVDILPYYLIEGRADPLSLRVWEMKIEILANTLEHIFGSAEKAQRMTERFRADLLDEDTLLYNLLFMVQGTV